MSRKVLPVVLNKIQFTISLDSITIIKMFDCTSQQRADVIRETHRIIVIEYVVEIFAWQLQLYN